MAATHRLAAAVCSHYMCAVCHMGKELTTAERACSRPAEAMVMRFVKSELKT